MSSKHDRQSFLGENSEEILGGARIGIVGLGGGGSHITQQAAHLGFRRYVIYDDDRAECSNLNRLIGGTVADVPPEATEGDTEPQDTDPRVAPLGTLKTDIAKRIILGLEPQAQIKAVNKRWQDDPEHLYCCDLVFGCVDSFAERAQLEAACRRFAIPLIDIGLDLHQDETAEEPPVLGGQVILSMPGEPCMRCLGFLTEKRLAEEARRYGAGSRPQVVNANGVLASLAVGIAVDLLTDWTKSLRGSVYLSYRANTGKVGPHPRLPYAPQTCTHYPLAEAGDPRVQPL